jgi:hypothetical protein
VLHPERGEQGRAAGGPGISRRRLPLHPVEEAADIAAADRLVSTGVAEAVQHGQVRRQ